MSDGDDTIISRVERRLRQKYEGDDRRQQPVISDGMKWLVGVAAPVVGALIVMYSTQQVTISKIETIKEQHQADMQAYKDWNASISHRLRDLEKR